MHKSVWSEERIADQEMLAKMMSDPEVSDEEYNSALKAYLKKYSADENDEENEDDE